MDLRLTKCENVGGLYIYLLVRMEYSLASSMTDHAFLRICDCIMHYLTLLFAWMHRHRHDI